MEAKTKKDLAAEVAALRAENEKLRQVNTSSSVPELRSYSLSEELNKINRTARVDTNTVKVQDFTDHKNISLWDKLGRRYGPMHRDNAVATLRRFADIGVALTVDKPTEAQIEAYKRTDEYKVWKQEQDRKRAIKNKSLRKENFEKLVAEMAKSTGQTADAVNRLLSSPKSLLEGQIEAGVK